MTFSKKYIYIVLLFLFFHLSLYPQQYRSPLDIPHALSANFGELRSNHFHSGLDFKTQQVINKPIYAVEDGFISRISVSPGGYGLALYIDHPSTGHTSVYGHLNSFSKKITTYVVEKQYELESYRIDVQLEPHQIPVSKGEQVALSGNTGSSGGPHLHFELRDTRSEDPIDPLIFYANSVADTQKPDLRGIAFYPVAGSGAVNNSDQPLRLTISKNGQGVPLPIPIPVKAWGKIGMGVKAYDKMNGQANIYGVKYVRLYVDDEQIFSSIVNRISFDKTRMINSFVDYEDWRERKSFFMKSFVEPGNTLNYYDAINKGYIEIDEERNYNMRYELEDHHGNIMTYKFVVQGVRQDISRDTEKCDNFMPWSLYNSYMSQDFILDIPSGNFYISMCYNHKITQSDSYFSNIYQVHNNPVPLHNSAKMWIQLRNDTLQNRQQYGIVEITKSGKTAWVGGDYKNGGISTGIRELGKTYAIEADTTSPVITPVNQASWVSGRKIQLRLSDDKSGIAHFRGTINGKYVLFSHDMKSSVYTYIFDDSRLEKGQKQQLQFIATDGAGNVSEYNYEFTY